MYEHVEFQNFLRTPAKRGREDRGRERMVGAGWGWEKWRLREGAGGGMSLWGDIVGSLNRFSDPPKRK
jgi:hypothetical protein